MIYKQLEVEIPAKKRIRTSSPHYVYEILSRNPDKVICVGVAINETMMNPNDKYYDLHKEKISNKALGEPKEFDNQVHLGASLLIRSVAQSEGLTNILNESFPGKTELLLSLSEYYLLRRDSASQLFKYYLSDHYSELNYIPSETSISNLFNIYLDHKIISNFLSSWMNYRVSLNGFSNHIDIDFDSTNRNSNSKNLSLSEYGKAKVDEGLPQINTAYFLDRENGLPIYFDIYYGSIVDVAHCKTALDKLKTVNPNIEGHIVLDRGYFSMSNLEYLTKNSFCFTCMGKEGKVFSKLINEHPKEAISKPINRIYKTIYGLKMKGKAFEEGKNEYNLYLFYNEADVASEVARIQDDIEYCAKNLLGKEDKKEYIRDTYGKRINIVVDDEDIIIEAKPNYDYIENYKKEFGYFWIISTEDTSPSMILKSYRYRDLVEKEMKYSKSLCDLEKTFASTDNAFEGKILLGFIASIIRSTIISKLKPYFLQYSNETSQTVLNELDKIKAEEINDVFVLRFALTKTQKQIMSLFGLTLKDVYELIEKLNFTRKLVNKTVV